MDFSAARNAGFTLVEIIVGIVITGISLAVATTLIYPLFVRSVDPMLQVRAAEYAQAIMQDVLSKRYDENTPVGGQPPCIGAGCSTEPFAVDTGEGGGTRAIFDDVDDFNVFCNGGTPNTSIQDVFGSTLSSEYGGYLFSTCVAYAGADFLQANESAKRVTVTVRPPPPATEVIISAYRGNY